MSITTVLGGHPIPAALFTTHRESNPERPARSGRSRRWAEHRSGLLALCRLAILAATAGTSRSFVFTSRPLNLLSPPATGPKPALWRNYPISFTTTYAGLPITGELRFCAKRAERTLV